MSDEKFKGVRVSGNTEEGTEEIMERRGKGIPEFASEDEAIAIERGNAFESHLLSNIDKSLKRVSGYIEKKEEQDFLVKEWNDDPLNEKKIRFSRALMVKNGLSTSVPLMDTWMGESTLGGKERHDRYYDIVRKVDVYGEANELDSINRLIVKYYLPILEGKIKAPEFWSCHYGPVPNTSEDSYEEDCDNPNEAMKLREGFIREICRKLGYLG